MLIKLFFKISCNLFKLHNEITGRMKCPSFFKYLFKSSKIIFTFFKPSKPQLEITPSYQGLFSATGSEILETSLIITSNFKLSNFQGSKIDPFFAINFG